jgi:2,3-dihydroxybiphenyl 1,2-dioxygenase
MSVSCLGYLGLRASDLAAWSRFAADILGFMPAPAADGELRFRTDAQSWRLSVAAGPEDDLDFVGFEVSGPAALAEMGERLTAAGVSLGNDDPDLAKARGVTGLISCRDPQGLRVEIYYGPTERHETPFASPAGVGGFVTGEEGVGHVVLTTPDIAAARAFYQDVLGFRLSDIIAMPIGRGRTLEMEFYHCNARHHTLALVPAPAPKRLHHFMVQVRTLDEVGFALQRAEGAGVPITATLGRHTNDHMVSFYARTPSGFEVEYGFGARTVDDATWRVARHDAPSSWGHRRGAVGSGDGAMAPRAP